MRRVTTVLMLLLSVGVSAAASPAGAASRSLSPTADVAPCQSPSLTTVPSVPPAQVRVVEKEVMALAGRHFAGIGQCAHGLLFLSLTPGSEATARRIRARFGPSVQIMIGFTSWDGKPGRSPKCPALPSDPRPQPDITATLHLDATRLTAGANLRGHVVFRNAGTSPMRVLTVQPINVVLVQPGTHRVVGAYSGAVAGTGYGPLLTPGQTQTVAIAGGTARCDGGIGSVTPPGRYDAVGLVSGPGITGTPPPGNTLTNEVPVQVVGVR